LPKNYPPLRWAVFQCTRLARGRIYRLRSFDSRYISRRFAAAGIIPSVPRRTSRNMLRSCVLLPEFCSPTTKSARSNRMASSSPSTQSTPCVRPA
jgi:hypothetical protein